MQRHWLNTLWHAPVAVAFLDREARCRRVNQALSEIMCSSADELVGTPLCDMRPFNQMGPVLRCCLERVLVHGERIRHIELSVDESTSPDADRYFDACIHPIWSGHEIVGACLFIDELTEGRRLERERDEAMQREHEARVESAKREKDLWIALDAADLGIWRHEVDTDATLLDERSASLLGVSVGSSRAVVLGAVIAEDRGIVHRALMDLVLRGRAAAEFRVAVPAGVRWLRGTARAFVDDTAALSRVVGTLQDVTLRKAWEAEVEARAELERTLVGIVSHDLRNPIAATRMTAEALLRRDRPQSDMRRGLARIVTSSDRAARLISDLLDFTQARLSGIRLVASDGDLVSLVEEAIDEVRAAHPERPIESRHEGSARGRWDCDRLMQVVTNLVVNAVSYSPIGTPVAVCTRSEEARVHLSVHNMGAPIPAEMLDVLFQPLQRGDHRASRATRSIGLGLFIVDQIVRGHGGRIDVASAAASGTTFTVTLPRAMAAPVLPLS